MKNVKVTKDKVTATLKAIHALVQKDVMVGVPQSTADRLAGSPITNAEIGYIQEFGAPGANIPARPHLVPGIEGAEKQIGVQLKKGATAALDGNAQGVEDALHGAGLTGQSAVKAKIRSVIPPPLKAGTLAARQRRGHTGDVPLIEYGKYLGAITYVIRKKS